MDPFKKLKNRLVELLTPSILDQCTSIRWGAELGGPRPTELLKVMIAALPPNEPDGHFFKAIFLHRLPGDLKDLGPTSPTCTMHMDLVGPLPASRGGSTYLLTMIDHSNRWPEAVPVGCIDVEMVLEAFITTWVAHFVMTPCITTNRGTQFTSGTWGDWCKKQGVHHITTTA